MPSYTGASKSSIYQKQADLRRAAIGTAKLSTFFGRAPSHSPTMTTAPSARSYSVMPHTIADTTDSSDWEDIIEVVPPAPVLVPPPTLAPASPPITPETPNIMSLESMSEINIINSNTEVPSHTTFLDPTADDEYQPLQIPVGTTVTELIKEAKKHQSFGALFKLHAVRNYLELLERYRRIPNIKNPATRASIAVAKSVGKGPYFAKNIRHLVIYIDRFHTLPPARSGKHHAHPSLLNNERISQAVRRYLTVQEIGEVKVSTIIQHNQDY